MGRASSASARTPRVIRSSPSPTEILWGGLALLVVHRHLLWEMTKLRLKLRYTQSMLGWSWAVVAPLLLMVTYILIFSKVADVHSDGVPYALFVFTGLVPWTFFSTSISTATASMVTHRYLISRVAFPREIIPLSYVAASLADLVVGIVMLAVMFMYFKYCTANHVVYMLHVIPLCALLIAWAVGGALCCASCQARFRDLGVAMPLLLQVAMFTTPVVYSSEAIPEKFKALYFANPLAFLIDGIRRVILFGEFPNLDQLLYSFLVATIFLCFSYFLFKRLDATLADVI
jgi:lipopolysaccharide transport system permease protein